MFFVQLILRPRDEFGITVLEIIVDVDSMRATALSIVKVQTPLLQSFLITRNTL